jgi:hypothetical protein
MVRRPARGPKQLPLFLRCTLFVPALGFAGGALLVLAGASAQSPAPSAIHVVSNQVVIPVIVYSKERWEEAERSGLMDRTKFAAIAANVPIRGLTAKDFHLLEDNQEQKIQSVTVQPSRVFGVRDIAGQHVEEIGAGGGRWIYPDMPNDDQIHVITYPNYSLAYVPPFSPDGSCHQITVKIDNPDALVWNLKQYCKVASFVQSDPLIGTKFGSKLEADLDSDRKEHLQVSLAATALFSSANHALVCLALAFSPKKLDYDDDTGALYEQIGMLGKIYAQDRTVVMRLSDFDCCQMDQDPGSFEGDWGGWYLDDRDVIQTPSSYETQLSLPPGEYHLHAVVSDGDKFGRAVMIFTVPALDGKQLALTDIVLARRCRQPQLALAAAAAAAASSHEDFVPLVSKGVEYVPTADAAFRKKTDRFYFYFELYEPPTAVPAPDVKVRMRIVDAQSGGVIRNLPTLNAAYFADPGNPIVRVGGGVHIRDLIDGPYRLEVQAFDSNGQTTPWHSASFSIQK